MTEDPIFYPRTKFGAGIRLKCAPEAEFKMAAFDGSFLIRFRF